MKNGAKILTDIPSNNINRWQITIWKDAQHYISLGNYKLTQKRAINTCLLKLQKIQHIETSNDGKNRKQKEELLFINSKNVRIVHLVWKAVCQL